MRKKETVLAFAVTAVFVVLWTMVMLSGGAEAVVEKIGVRNGYLVTFIVAVLGGISVITVTPYYTTLITFALGGLNPFLLGLIAGIGATIGDSVFYYLGMQGHQLLAPKYHEKMHRFSGWLLRGPRWLIPVVTYIYTGLTPLPQDVLMVALALANIHYKRVIPFVLLGNITLATIIGTIVVSSAKSF